MQSSGERAPQSRLCLDLPRKHCLWALHLTEDLWETYLLPEFVKRAGSAGFFNPPNHLGISTAHTDYDPETSAH